MRSSLYVINMLQRYGLENLQKIPLSAFMVILDKLYSIESIEHTSFFKELIDELKTNKIDPPEKDESLFYPPKALKEFAILIAKECLLNINKFVSIENNIPLNTEYGPLLKYKKPANIENDGFTLIHYPYIITKTTTIHSNSNGTITAIPQSEVPIIPNSISGPSCNIPSFGALYVQPFTYCVHPINVSTIQVSGNRSSSHVHTANSEIDYNDNYPSPGYLETITTSASESHNSHESCNYTESIITKYEPIKNLALKVHLINPNSIVNTKKYNLSETTAISEEGYSFKSYYHWDGLTFRIQNYGTYSNQYNLNISSESNFKTYTLGVYIEHNNINLLNDIQEKFFIYNKFLPKNNKIKLNYRNVLFGERDHSSFQDPVNSLAIVNVTVPAAHAFSRDHNNIKITIIDNSILIHNKADSYSINPFVSIPFEQFVTSSYAPYRIISSEELQNVPLPSFQQTKIFNDRTVSIAGAVYESSQTHSYAENIYIDYVDEKNTFGGSEVMYRNVTSQNTSNTNSSSNTSKNTYKNIQSYLFTDASMCSNINVISKYHPASYIVKFVSINFPVTGTLKNVRNRISYKSYNTDAQSFDGAANGYANFNCAASATTNESHEESHKFVYLKTLYYYHKNNQIKDDDPNFIKYLTEGTLYLKPNFTITFSNNIYNSFEDAIAIYKKLKLSMLFRLALFGNRSIYINSNPVDIFGSPLIFSFSTNQIQNIAKEYNIYCEFEFTNEIATFINRNVIISTSLKYTDSELDNNLTRLHEVNKPRHIITLNSQDEIITIFGVEKGDRNPTILINPASLYNKVLVTTTKKYTKNFTYTYIKDSIPTSTTENISNTTTITVKPIKLTNNQISETKTITYHAAASNNGTSNCQITRGIQLEENKQHSITKSLNAHLLYSSTVVI